MSSPLVRTAVMVHSIARSRVFYEQVLGLAGTYLNADLTDTVSQKLLGLPPGAAVRALILKPRDIAGRPAPDFGMIGLFEIAGAPEPPAPPRADGVRYGEPVLVFYVPDLDAALEAVVRTGGRRMTGPEAFEIPGVRVREAIVRDPEGVAVNLVEASDAVTLLETQR